MGRETDDFALLNAWRDGDHEAGDDLFRRHVRSVYRFFRNKAPDAVDDLTQRTMLALVEGRDWFEHASSFRTYMFGVARNQLLMHLRTAYREGARFDPDAWSLVQLSGAGGRQVAAAQERELVQQAMRRLPVDYQVALELHYFEELGVAEIAEVQDVSVGTVKSRLSRGRKLLRDRVAELAASEELLRSAVADLERSIRALPTAVKGGDDPA